MVLPGNPLLDGPTALRPWRDSDIGSLVAACQDPEIGRWTRVPSPYREADARAYLLQRYEGTGNGTFAPFAIVDARGGEHLLGSVSLMRIVAEHAHCEVGYWLAREARGQGHASRAVRLICEWGFRTLGLQRIELLAAAGNRASQQVAQRAGFTREAELRSHTKVNDDRLDMVAYGLLAAEAGAEELSSPKCRAIQPASLVS